MNENPIAKQSTVIDTLRYPMIILVLFIHVVPTKPHVVPLNFESYSLYLLCTELIAHNIGRIAVPIFFLISGYLFFRKAPQEFEFSFFTNQWKKRIGTLIIPYILWNVLKYLLTGGKGYLQHTLGFGGDEDITFFHTLNLYSIFVEALDYPLWYVRDLICMVAISPLFYLLFRNLKHWGLLILAIWYFSTLETGVYGFSLTAIFYFGIGAYYGISKRILLTDFSKLSYAPIIVSLIIFIIGTLTNNVGDTKEYWMRPAILLGVVGAFQLTSVLIDKYHQFRDVCLKQAENVFFIFAVHELYLKNWLNGAFARIDIPSTYVDNIIGYFIQPIILLGICLGINYIMKRYFKKAYAILTGGRA